VSAVADALPPKPRLLDRVRVAIRVRHFPATRFYVARLTRQRRRHHLHESILQRVGRPASRGRDPEARVALDEVLPAGYRRDEA
jgi:hypothetical protein